MKKESIINVKKLDDRPGIYIIYNIDSHKVYIGQSKTLKSRTIQHIRSLYVNKDDSRLLQEEFNAGGHRYNIDLLRYVEEVGILDKFESIYYQAAVKYLGQENVYNVKELIEYRASQDEIKIAIEDIKKSFKMKRKDVSIYNNATQVRLRLKQDWLGVDENEIINRTKKLLIEKSITLIQYNLIK